MAFMRVNFFSQTLGMYTNVSVMIPSFNQDFEIPKKMHALYPAGMKFQVLWLLHGGSDDDSLFQNCTNVMRYANDNKLAVIIPCDYNARYTDFPRSAKYFTFIAEELRDFLCANFPISDKPEDNFVSGNSMGGGGATKLALSYPERFAAAVFMSGGGVRPPIAVVSDGQLTQGHVDFRKQMADLEWPMPAIPSDALPDNPQKWLLDAIAAKRKLPKFYITCGDIDQIATQGAREAIAYMTSLGCDITGEIVPGYKHEWDFWDLALRKAICEWLPLKRSHVAP
jgi:putative tributyrin esterase